jgi:PRC-barrel domain
MLDKAKTLIGYKLQAIDGELGTVKDFYFDDHSWTIRYLVVDAGEWLLPRQVLISPHALGAVKRAERHIAVDLTMKQVEHSPALNRDKPVSRQFETEYASYFGMPLYWFERERESARKRLKHGDPHLRSVHEVTSYKVEAADGEIGHVEGFLVDDETWTIRYLIVDTHRWLPGRTILISPTWINRITWHRRHVAVGLEREAIEKSPEYSNESHVTRDYEASLHRHYDREGYWVDEPPSSREPR